MMGHEWHRGTFTIDGVDYTAVWFAGEEAFDGDFIDIKVDDGDTT
jgi:hypothetical protein